MNVYSIAGNLTEDPQLKETRDGSKVVNISIAINNIYKKDTGELTNNPTFLVIEAWDSAAALIAEKFQKGDLIIAECSLHNWEKDGVSKTKIRMNRFEGPYIKRKS